MTTETRAAKAVERAYSILEIKELKDGARIIKGTATTPRPDRVGDIVEPLGVSFKNPLPLLHQHNHDAPVGTVTFDKPTKRGITFTAKLAKVDEPGPLRDRIETAWGELKSGLVRAVSIGFRTLEHAVMENGGWRFLETEVLELSLVTVPANADCTITSIKSIDRQLRAASGTSQKSDRNTTARFGASHKKPSVKGETLMTTISEQISALEADEANIVKQLTKFDVDNMEEADEDRFDDLEDDLAGIRKKLKRLRVQENLTAEKTAKPVKKSVDSDEDGASSRNPSYRDTTADGPNKNIPKGIPFARVVKCVVNANGNSELAALLAERNYPDDKRIANYLRLTPEQKTAIPGANTTGTPSGWADAIAAANVGNEFIELLRARSIIDKFGQNGVPALRSVPFNVKVSRMTSGHTGSWVGEALPSPVSKGAFDTVTMGKTKVGGTTYMSKELMMFAHVAAESIIRDDLVAAVVARADSTFVSTSSAVANASPAGLLQGLSPISATGTGDADDVRTDLQNLYATFSAANIPVSGVVLVMPEQHANALMMMRNSLGVREFPDVTRSGGFLEGYPIISSNHVGAGDIIAISAPDILLADESGVDVSVSDQASIETIDDGNMTQTGRVGTGVAMLSLWQTEMVGIKITRMINWQKARTAAVAYVGDAAWNGAPSA